MKPVIVSGGFNRIQFQAVRFLEEATKYGSLYIYLWSDNVYQQLEGRKPEFPQEERKYFLESIRYVHRVIIVDKVENRDEIPQIEGVNPGVWVVLEQEDSSSKQYFCADHKIEYFVVNRDDLEPTPSFPKNIDFKTFRKKVIVSGSFDWLHSGHIRFFEETSELGDLYVVVGSDKNVRLLKGDEHPMFSEDKRLYMVQAVRFVKHALISSGSGWMDAEPEIERIKPDIYAVNEDGDKPEKREFCQKHGLEYLVLKRVPKKGLTQRRSTDLRGF